MSKQERRSERAHSRIRALVTADAVDKPLQGFTRDISHEGLFIETRSPLPPGTPIRVTLQYPDKEVELEGVVVRAERVPVQLQGVIKAGMGIRVKSTPAMAKAAGEARNTRVPLGSDVVMFFGSERLRLKLHDLSASGAALVSDELLPEITFVRLHLKLPSTAGVIELEGVPVEQRPLGEQSLIAIQFLDPPAEFVSQIEALIGERGEAEEE